MSDYAQGLYVVTDMYPFHRQARKVSVFSFSVSYKLTSSVQLNLWTMGFLIAPFLSPFAFGFLVAREKLDSLFFHDFFLTIVHVSVGDGHIELVRCTAHSFFSLSCSSDVRRKSVHHRYGPRSHSSRMYDRGVKGLLPQPVDSLHYRIETLVGVTGFKMAKYRATWGEAISAPFKLFWRPHLLSIMVFEVRLNS